MKKNLICTVFIAGTSVLLNNNSPAQTLFATDLFLGNVYEYASDGTASTFASGLSAGNLGGIASDASGDLYVADTTGGNILKIAPNGVSTMFASGLDDPQAITLDAAGNLFAITLQSGSDSSDIVEIKPDGSQSIFASGLGQDPIGLAFDGSDDLFMASRFSHTITEFQANGTQSSIGSGLILVNALAFDAAGNLFLTSATRIFEITPNGTQSTFATLNNSQLNSLAFDNMGNLFVAEELSGNIIEIAPDATQTTFSSGAGFPEALAFQGTVLPVPEPPVWALSFAAVGTFLVRLKHKLKGFSPLEPWTYKRGNLPQKSS